MLEINTMPGHVIRRLNQIATSIFQDRVKAQGYDLTPVQFAAMNAIRAHPGIDQASLSGAIAHDRATIGGVVERLEAKGYVTRAVSQRDRRAREIALTPLGVEVLDYLLPVVRGFQANILSGLSETEREQFLRLAEKAAMAGNALSRAPLLDVAESD